MKIKIKNIENLIMEILSDYNVNEEISITVMENLMKSELEGHKSHGLLRLIEYINKVKTTKIDPNKFPKITKISTFSSIIYGNNSFGAVTLQKCEEEAYRILDSHELAIIGVQDSNHLGRLAHFTKNLSNNGYLTLGFVNYMGGGQSVPIWNGKSGKLCTNPLTIGFPSFSNKEAPIVIDMTTSNVSEGYIRDKYINNKSVKNGAIIDENWKTIKDPKMFYSSKNVMLTPLGGSDYGYKGTALAIAIEILAGIINNSAHANKANKNNDGNSGLFIIMKPDILGGDLEKIKEDIKSLKDHLKDDSHTLLPGEKSFMTYQNNIFKGEIEVSEIIYNQLINLRSAK